MSLHRISSALRSSRAYASVSSLAISRPGLQAAVAPLVVKSLSKTANGIQIATVDDKGPVSSVAVVLNLGSRHEAPDAPGAAHLLKNILVRNLEDDTIVRTVRGAEFRGNTLSTTVTREHLILASEFLRDDLVDVVPELLNLLFNKSFQPYEFLDAIPSVIAESQAHLSLPETKIWEEAHTLAFRSGLGSPLFITKAAAGNLKRSSLTSLLEKSINPSRLVIIGSGIDHSELSGLVSSSLATKTFPTEAESTVAPSKYYGGETRIDAGPNSKAKYLFAFPTVGIKSSNYFASAILAALLNGSSKTQWGNPSGLLASASTASTTASTDLKSYTDIGLIGIKVEGHTGEVSFVGQRAINVLKSVASGSIPEAALAGAKNSVIVDLESAGREDVVANIARQVLALGNFSTSKEFAEKIQKVTAADVARVAKEALSSKATIVAYGNTGGLPFADSFTF
ncbi:ubiquinol-cytochrome c reductase core subunit 1 [Nowakowskiella sp. JEL0078]|nr:ubiquinol-cytochrome c reductase core subunit 1 [Nowakowskiella sp. JEL0078]